MSKGKIVRCPYPDCNNQFNFKHAGKLFRINEGNKKYIVTMCPKCKGLLKYRKGIIYKF